jgi:hypothetical protein
LDRSIIEEFADALLELIAAAMNTTHDPGPAIREPRLHDARHARGPSMDVSGDWAVWLGRHRDELRHVSMLTGSRFVQLTADFVRRFAELGEIMRIRARSRTRCRTRWETRSTSASSQRTTSSSIALNAE